MTPSELETYDEMRSNLVTGSNLVTMKIADIRPANEFRFYKNHEYARTPKKAHPTDAGYDLYACEHCMIPAKQWKVVNTGIKLDIPSNWEVQVRSRSGLAAKKGVAVLNSPGTIDEDYTGEIKVILINHGEYDFHVAPGDRIAQAIFSPLYPTSLVEIYEEPSNKSRGESGFGSSGV